MAKWKYEVLLPKYRDSPVLHVGVLEAIDVIDAGTAVIEEFNDHIETAVKVVLELDETPST